MGFFTENYNAINDFSNKLEKFSPTTKEEEIASLIRVAIKAVTFNREEYDQLTPYSTSRQGAGLLKIIQEPLDEQTLGRILLFFAGFIREATLVRESRSDSEQVVLSHFLGQQSHDDEWSGYYEDYLRYVLPNKLFESNYREIDRARSDSNKLIEDTEARAQTLQQRIEGYRAELKNFESEYNFVGLSHAFRDLLGQKRRERNWTFGAVILLGLLISGVLIAYLFNAQNNFFIAAFKDGWSPTAVAHLVGAFGIELILLYFFRIALKAFLLVREQITNLQLRVSLCTFIEGYLDFATKAQQAKASMAIQGFESLTFAPLPAGDGSIPSTLEGLDQIVRLAQAVNPKSP